MSPSLWLIVFVCFAAAAVAPAVVRLDAKRSGWWLALAPLAGFIAAALHVPRLIAGEELAGSIAWLPSLGVEFALRMDGLSSLFVLMITGIGVCIVVYGGAYLRGDRAIGRFHLLLLAFTGAMLGSVLADDLLLLFVFWELTSLTSYFLVGYRHEDADARTSALQALLITATGGLAMLAGFLIVGSAAGTFQISELVQRGDQIAASGVAVPALILIALGAFTKSAQFPFHVWLPNAMAAPTPVSAFLHSATMVKLGIYLLARLHPAFGGLPAWFWLLTIAGAATMLVAAGLAFRHRDLKSLLAYSTLGVLGVITMLLGVGTSSAVKAAVVFLLAHSLYKASLFMVAGNLDHETGTRNVERLAGLGRLMPVTFVAALLAGLSTAGIPPKLGFIGKEFAYDALLGLPWLLVAAIATNAVMVGIAALVGLKPFVGKRSETPEAPHEAPVGMLAGPLLLALLGLTFGLFPALVEAPLVRPATSSILGAPYAAEVYLWKGYTPAVAWSAVTIALGILLFAYWRRIRIAVERFAPRLDVGPARAYALLLAWLPVVAAWQTQAVESRGVRRALYTVLGFMIVLVGTTAIVHGAFAEGFGALSALPAGDAFVWTIAAWTAAAAVAAILARTRLGAVAALSVVGFGVALQFVLHAAPDLAITQFLVETLLVIVVALIMIRLPAFQDDEASSRGQRTLDIALATAGGALIAALTFAVSVGPLPVDLASFFEAESVPGGRGRNIVNVILVDFRAIDTLGEIFVLMVAGSGVAALLGGALRTRSGARMEEGS